MKNNKSIITIIICVLIALATMLYVEFTSKSLNLIVMSILGFDSIVCGWVSAKLVSSYRK